MTLGVQPNGRGVCVPSAGGAKPAGGAT
jgi:hypothetical protein